MVFAIVESTLFGVAALIFSLIGAVLSIAGYITNRKTAAEKANEEQYKQLLECREESERLSADLFTLRQSARKAMERHDDRKTTE